MNAPLFIYPLEHKTCNIKTDDSNLGKKYISQNYKLNIQNVQKKLLLKLFSLINILVNNIN